MCDLPFRGVAGVCWLVISILAASYGSAWAATVVLKDGTVIHGEIKSLQDDVYIVETDSLGTLRVPKLNVRTIDYGDETATRSPAAGSPIEQAELQAMQSRMMQTPNLLSMILALQNDPDVQAVLADPEIMGAIASGNYAALMNHPKLIALMSNATVREIIEGVQ